MPTARAPRPSPRRAHPEADPALEPRRQHIAALLRAHRQRRGWTQAALAARLGLSQARLSELERGAGSFDAEQLLTAADLLEVPLAELLPPVDPEDALQAALRRWGAAHLRPVPGAQAAAARLSPAAAVLATLTGARSARLLTALAPVLVAQADALPLPALRLELRALGREPRLGWLLENLQIALAAEPPGADPAWRQQAGRARALIEAELPRICRPDPGGSIDLLDPTIRSTASRELVWQEQASAISRGWGIVSALQPEDFRAALWSAHDAG